MPFAPSAGRDRKPRNLFSCQEFPQPSLSQGRHIALAEFTQSFASRLRRCRRGLHNGPDLAGEQSQIAARGGVFCYVPAIPLLVPDKQLLAPELLQKKMGSWQGRRKRMNRLGNLTGKTYR